MFILLYTRDGDTCRHTLRPGDTVLGRAPICDLIIEDPSISRRHVRFRVHGGHCVLTDLGGRNGTFLNGEQVTEAEVKPGDTVVLGRFPIRIEHGDAEPLVLSDEHAIVESVQAVGTMQGDDVATRIGSAAAADPERLLLLLSEISRKLVRPASMPEILERVISVLLGTVAVERAFLLLLDTKSGELVPRVVRSCGAQPVTGASVSRTLVRRALQDRVALLGTDVLRGEARSFICAPLWHGDRGTGVLYGDNPADAALTAADLQVLQALATYAAAVIEHAIPPVEPQKE